MTAAAFLAFDYGTRRIGVASGNTVTSTATPVGTIDATRVDESFAAIGRLITEWQPDALVVGLPRHPDGQPHEMTRLAERFARRLEGRFGLPVHGVDERYTSVEAQSRGRAGKELDARSAAVILEQFFFERQQTLALDAAAHGAAAHEATP